MSEQKDKNLLTIGDLSGLTGVHVKSLRYYDELGVLPPAWVDPETRYRYYTFSQIRLVESIRLFIELDIPLARFHEYTARSGEICFSRLVEDGRLLAEEKLKSIADKLGYLELMRADIVRAERIPADGPPARLDFPAKTALLSPFCGTQHDPEFHAALGRLLRESEDLGLKVGYELGMALLPDGDGLKSYVFADIRENEGARACPRVARIPAARYACVKRRETDISRAPALFGNALPAAVFEVELLTGSYDYSSPVFELRCALPAEE